MTLKTASFLFSPGFPHYGLYLNPEKTDAVLFGTYQSAKSLSNTSNINVAGTSVALSDKVKLLGVTLNRHLTFDSHIVQVCCSAHFHTRALRHIRNVISNDMAKSVAQALGLCKFDLIRSIKAKHYKTSASTKYTGSSGDALQSLRQYYIQLQKLHWLPIKQRIDFKMCVLSFKTLTINSPAFLATHLNS